MVVAGDFLRPQVLLDGHREIGAAFHRRVVGDDQTFALAHAADSGHQSGGGRLIVVHFVRRKR